VTEEDRKRPVEKSAFLRLEEERKRAEEERRRKEEEQRAQVISYGFLFTCNECGLTDWAHGGWSVNACYKCPRRTCNNIFRIV